MDTQCNILIGASNIKRLSKYCKDYDINVVAKAGLTSDDKNSIQKMYREIQQLMIGKPRVCLVFSPLFNDFFPGNKSKGHYLHRKRRLSCHAMAERTKKLIQNIVNLRESEQTLRVGFLLNFGRRAKKCRKRCKLCISYRHCSNLMVRFYKSLKNVCPEYSVPMFSDFFDEFYMTMSRKDRRTIRHNHQRLLSGRLSKTAYQSILAKIFTRCFLDCKVCRGHLQRQGDHVHYCCSRAETAYITYVASTFATVSSMHTPDKN